MIFFHVVFVNISTNQGPDTRNILLHHNSTFCDFTMTGAWVSCVQGKLTNNRYTQCEFKFKFSTLFKPYNVKYTENSKNITAKNNFLGMN